MRRPSAFVHVSERSTGIGSRGFRDALHAEASRLLAPVARGFVFWRGLRVWSLALDPVDERFLLVGSATSRVLLFDLHALDGAAGDAFDAHNALPPVCSARAVADPGGSVALQFGVSAVDWYPVDGGIFVSSALDGRVRVWDSDAFTVVSEFALGSKVFCAKFSRVATSHALVAAATAQHDVRLCDMAVGAATHSLLGHRDEVWALAWSLENEFQLATGARDGEVRLWDIRRSGSTACLLCLNHEGSASVPGRANVLTNGRRTPSLSLSAASRPASRKRQRLDALDAAAAARVRSSSSSSLASGTARARRNDPHAAASVSSATAHLAGVNSLAYTPDGRFLLSSGVDQRLRLWNSATGEHAFANYEGVQNQVAARSVQMAVVQEADAASSTLVFHPNGRDGQLNAYQVFGDRGTPLLRATAHYGQITACVYRRTTRELFTGGEDGIIMKWQPPAPAPALGAERDDADESKAAGRAIAGAVPGDADAWSDDDDGDGDGDGDGDDDPGDVFIPPILRQND
ncbi:hypothetical protein PybrP1_005245 [[Pythium] brassicae (nom. inval.)]|nr:hypothetical protein PybrP1_005245 [[Pythium] brassicae (nom. inval.)]